ncbi:Na/Pi cotransporter family protein [Roseomonas sp. NAR14]|uniref:Na/Pi cotransporter family protein n=1 Tax=Roseomonas acroporae TaxID=2937791 RepID=A0A9X2BW65_9PROT|nr:Na/Pi cotransporter family protein [Roseomonas acroporae]MCK8784709.1 Na/Pi cotransporter family protein [Roseomonas acroporae]
MTQLRFLIELAGEAALLLWGLHMVQSGILRAFGSRLRAVLGVALGDRWRAFLAGLGVTAALQSSTATALMVGSFSAGGTVALVPALAAMLGANVGTALIVQVLAFDVSAVYPGMILAGVVAFRRGRMARTRDLGRAAIGLGLMLLSLHLMVETMAPISQSPELRGILRVVAQDPLPNLVIAAVLAWAVHSSVAAVLFVATLAGAGAISPEATVAMVAGANLGSAFNPLLEGRSQGGSQKDGREGDLAALRVPVGNLLNRLAGCLLIIPLLGPIAALSDDLASPALLVAPLHLGFNLALALLFILPLPAFARLLERFLPERAAGTDPAAPRYLDEAALATPPVALAGAAREALRMADVVEAMLRGSRDAFGAQDRETPKRVARQDDVVDGLHRAIHDYLARIRRDSLGDDETRRLTEIQGFAINLEHAGDIVEQNLLRNAARRIKRGTALPPAALAEIAALYDRVLEQLRLAVAVFMLEDAAAARRLVAEKERLRDVETEAARRLAEAGEGRVDGDARVLLLDIARDLKRIGAHLAATAYPLLERLGELRPSRLAVEEPEAALELPDGEAGADMAREPGRP